MNQNDQQIQELLDIITKQKKELKKPVADYETNMAFPWKNNFVINLTTVTSLIEVIGIMGYLISEKENHEKACNLLDIVYPFKHGQYSFDDWVEDLNSISYKISYKEKKKVLADTQERLQALMSKELKDSIELDKLIAIVSNFK